MSPEQRANLAEYQRRLIQIKEGLDQRLIRRDAREAQKKAGKLLHNHEVTYESRVQ